jgi:hypothetical protein
MRFENNIRREARKDAQTVFTDHQQDETILEAPERIRSLAQFQSNHFYQNGLVLLFLKPSLLGTEQEVKNLFTQTFIKTYTTLKQQEAGTRF